MHEDRTTHAKGESYAAARAMAEIALSKKAEDVRILDLRETSVGTDYFVICSGTSETQVRAIADEVQQVRKKAGHRVWRVEGHRGGRWVLLDYVDVVVHVFHPETRGYFSLETLWGDVSSERIEDEGTSP